MTLSSIPPPPPTISSSKKLVPISRPDAGGRLGANNPVHLLVNHFSLSFGEMDIYHYDVDVRPENLPVGSATVPEISKPDLSAIKRELFSIYSNELGGKNAAFDGLRTLYSPVRLPESSFSVSVRGRSLVVALKLVKSVSPEELTRPPIPREFLQGLDVIARENAAMGRIGVGRIFFSRHGECDLGMGVVALQGFRQSVKATEQGPVLCVDHAVMAFWKSVSVLQYLHERLNLQFTERSQMDGRMRSNAERELKGLKVAVTHREGRKKFVVRGLTAMKADDIEFEADESGSRCKLLDYFRNKYNREIVYKHLPCLDFSKNRKQNYVPMELCELAEGQIFPKEKLSRETDNELKRMQLIRPRDRRGRIDHLMNSMDGPGRGVLFKDFQIRVQPKMATADGRVLDRPRLKIRDMSGRPCDFRIQNDDCQWNLLKNKVSSGGIIDRWGIAEFGPSPRRRGQQIDVDFFVENFLKKCQAFGITVNPRPAVVMSYSMDVLSDHRQLRAALEEVIGEARGPLQILICPMACQDEGYKSLKLVAETELGLLTQCCLSHLANQGKDQYFSNLLLKMNAKLGGSNVELFDRLPRLGGAADAPVMFIGADVNHPGSMNATSPSIAAVVATVNWPGSNIYASEVRAQPHRRENIVGVGPMCARLVEKFALANGGARPQRIIYYRDGVSDSQFDMVLNQELLEIKAAVEGAAGGYRPAVTVVVAQKRHHTRLFPRGANDQLKSGNVPPGTVVDRGVVSAGLFNFFLCSHNGILGTSKPTHYYVLWDDTGFTSDEMQTLTYNLCFTFSRCTKPVSLVPPVYYADLLAYRGRQYYEAKLHLLHPASSSSSSSSAGGAPYDDVAGFPDLHENVKDAMYFV